jgi:hypothetical protein
VREIADWRLGEYLNRGEGSPEPVRSLQIGESHSRKRIPALFGARSSPDWERSGFVWEGKNMILLVTLEKSGQPKEHQYEDRFLSAGTFQWQSQNRTTQRGKVGQAIRNTRGKASRFTCLRDETRKTAKKPRPFSIAGR